MSPFSFPYAVAVTDAEKTLALSGEVDTPFPLASVTKPIAAWAVLTQVSAGKVELDECVPTDSEYPTTLRQLLAHASGIDFESRLFVSPPETRRIYSNCGIEIAADFVAERVGTTAGELLRAEVVRPLGLDTWQFFESVAHGGVLSARDLIKFVREVMSPTLLPTELAKQALTVQYPELAGILPGFGKQDPNTWGLGFEIRDQKEPHWSSPENSPKMAGHFGQSGSFIWIEPERGLGAAFVGAKPFSQEHKAIWPELNTQILHDFAK
ncbi:hypothetical protein BK816_07410 [Boudabousia tangfeifanii]|uniref:Beta-lactamase-related domain-containing protein n=1 Tax=Boudabousia tangfeifanii TaxID=1912795 RepID=A0A1D9MLM9_9ACTO|nr:serine hydrolase domain-containing protein [Boudabousia tangfeifanii]AOZ73138.1 hypothetical protein BK816_07410 [Boudabousia tangfeifanii]